MKHFARKIFPLSLMTVALLFSYPNNLYAEEKKKISSLRIFLQAENAEKLQELINQGANINIQNTEGLTALYRAARAGKIEQVRLFLDNGAKPDLADNENRTPLLWAAHNGHTEVVKVLLDKGAKPDIASNKGRTPVYWAAFKGHTEVVKALLDKGAKADLADNENYTPLSWAENNGHSEIVALLIRHLVNKGVNVNTTYRFDNTFLHYAASGTSNIDLLHWLIDKGANVNAVNELNETPLDEAIHTFVMTQNSPYKELRQQREKVLAKIHLLYEHSNAEIQQKMKDKVDGLSKYQSKNTANQSLADEMAAKGKSFSPSQIDVQYAEEDNERAMKDNERAHAAYEEFKKGLAALKETGETVKAIEKLGEQLK